MRAVKVAVFHRDGIEVLTSLAGEKMIAFCRRVAGEMTPDRAAAAVVEVHGHGAGVLGWLKEHGYQAAGVDRTVPQEATREDAYAPADSSTTARTIEVLERDVEELARDSDAAQVAQPRAGLPYRLKLQVPESYEGAVRYGTFAWREGSIVAWFAPPPWGAVLVSPPYRPAGPADAAAVERQLAGLASAASGSPRVNVMQISIGSEPGAGDWATVTVSAGGPPGNLYTSPQYQQDLQRVVQDVTLRHAQANVTS